jgi:hypothetical protein
MDVSPAQEIPSRHYQVSSAGGLSGGVEALMLQTNATRAAFDGWVLDATGTLDGIEATHRAAMSEAKADLESKRKQVADAENKAGSFVGIRKSHEAAVAAERSALASLENLLHVLPEKDAALRTKVSAEAEAVAALQYENSRKRLDMEHQINELTRGIVMYKFLGLEFHRADDDRLLIRFTHLDPADWEREFLFHVALQCDDEYHVDGCSPQIDESILKSLLARLNAANEVDAMEFPGFVVEMRRVFKSMV